jgi:hypothetical protein
MYHRIRFITFFFFIWLVFSFFSCKKHTNKPSDPVDQLPAATQTGANTFGCLVNGQVVVIHKPVGNLIPDYGCIYQLTYNSTAGYVFAVSGTDNVDGCYIKNVGLRLDSVQLQETTYSLNTVRVDYGKSGNVNIAEGCSPSPVLMYTTTSNVLGQVIITHLDQQKQIVSGTFYFDAVEITRGDTVHVTDGRFDMHYTD